MILTPIMRALGRDLAGSLADDIRTYGLGPPRSDRPPVTDDDLAGLPTVVQRYVHRMGAVGLPPVGTLRMKATGQFRMKPDQRFMPCTVHQYDVAHPIARLFHMRLDLLGVVPMVGTDRYVDGEGRMQGKLLGLVTVADGSGPEFDIGELTTFLNDAVFFAPSMLLGLDVKWSEVDEHSFEVAITDAGNTVRAQVFLDDDDTPIDFSTTDRFADLDGGLVQARWTTPVGGWVRREDRRLVPTRGSAIWHLPDGELTYADFRFRPYDIEFDT